MTIITDPEAGEELRKFLAERSPEVIRASRATWREMADRLTARDIAFMRDTGQMSAILSEDMGQIYAEYLTNTLAAQWVDAADLAVSSLKVPNRWTLLDPETMARWIGRRESVLLQSLIGEQRKAVLTVLQRAVSSHPMGSRQLATVLRPVLGLTARQAGMVESARVAAIEAGASPKQAARQAAKLGERLQKRRAEVVARTELASAHNAGVDLAVQNGADSGVLQGVERTWLTQSDRRVCKICDPMDGQTVGVREEFKSDVVGDVRAPPAHVLCRCVVIYRTQNVIDAQRHASRPTARRSQILGPLKKHGSPTLAQLLLQLDTDTQSVKDTR